MNALRRFFVKLPDPLFLKKFPAFCRTRRLISAFTKAHHLSLS